MGKFKRIIKRVRVIILLVVLVLAVLAVHPKADTDGVAIRNIIKDSAAYEAGMEGPKATDTPTSREVIKSLNNIPITSVAEFSTFVADLEMNDSVQIKTDRGFYKATIKPEIKITQLNETELKEVIETKTVEKEINGTTQQVEENVTVMKEVPKTKEEVIGIEDLGIKVYPVPKTNIRKGLDLEGGTRVLLQPEEKVSNEDMDALLDGMKQRLNIFGLTDIIVRPTKDLSGNRYILVEIAGANEEEVKDLLARQGKFEAKIGEETAFIGGKDIVYVCRSAECAGIDPQAGCGAGEAGQWFCRFRFSISLTPEAAQKHSDITQEIPVAMGDGSARQRYLEQPLDLYLDDELVDTLQIGEDLKGRAVTDIAISGSGSGVNRETAIEDSLKGMKRLQTILITGSLPVKLKIVKTDEISPILGKEFIENAILVGLLAVLSVGVVIFIAYRKLSIALPVIFTMISEVVILLGFAALIGWDLDLAAIAGLIIAAGTGVDDQIVIADEVMNKKAKEIYSWKQRIKKAFFIIMAAYFTTVVAMVPLLFAGAGLIKGFAFTTIVGVSIGVFITRPAFAAVVEELLREH